jgi:hypothetical protein
MIKFLFLFTSFSFDVYGQKDLFKRHVIFAEVGGVGLAYSVNYEYRLLRSNENIVSVKLGSNFLGYNYDLSGNKYPFLGLILGLNYNLKQENKYTNFGISQFFLHGLHLENYPPVKGFEYYTYYYFGYTWSKYEKKTDVRVNVGILTNYKAIMPWAGLSFGIKF